MRRQVTTIFAVAGLALVPASAAAAQSLHTTDPRSPDARDAANVIVVPPGVIAKSTPTTPSAHGDGGGFGWDDAGIGAGGLVLVGSLAFGAGYLIRHRGPRAPLAH